MILRRLPTPPADPPAPLTRAVAHFATDDRPPLYVHVDHTPGKGYSLSGSAVPDLEFYQSVGLDKATDDRTAEVQGFRYLELAYESMAARASALSRVFADAENRAEAEGDFPPGFHEAMQGKPNGGDLGWDDAPTPAVPSPSFTGEIVLPGHTAKYIAGIATHVNPTQPVPIPGPMVFNAQAEALLTPDDDTGEYSQSEIAAATADALAELRAQYATLHVADPHVGPDPGPKPRDVVHEEADRMAKRGREHRRAIRQLDERMDLSGGEVR